MKALRKIGLLALIISLLTINLCYGQNTAKQTWTKGVEYAAQGKFKEAKEEFENALKVDPLYDPAKEALEVIEDVVDQKIKSKTAIHLFKGKSYREKAQWDEAIAEYNIALEINPKFAMAYNDRGIAYRWKGQYDQAISDHNKALEINPRYVTAYISRGITYGVKGQYDKAISDFNKAIEIDPRLAYAYYNRGLAYDNKGQHDQAIADFSKAIEINPRYAEAYSWPPRTIRMNHRVLRSAGAIDSNVVRHGGMPVRIPVLYLPNKFELWASPAIQPRLRCGSVSLSFPQNASMSRFACRSGILYTAQA